MDESSPESPSNNSEHSLRTDHELPASFEHAAPAPPQPPQAPPPPPAPATPAPAPAAPPQPSDKQHVSTSTLISQWLTYAFWGWTVLILSILTYTVFYDFLDQGDSSSFNYYVISATLVLLPISFICDYLYSKQEPQKKTGAASIIMVVHAVLFALFGIGSLIWCVFSLVSLLTGDSGDHSSAYAGLFSSLIIAVFYAATFARTLNPPQLGWIAKTYRLFVLVVVTIFIILGFVGAHHNANKDTYSGNYDSYSDNSDNTSSDPYIDKEELNKQGQRRPAQYRRICDTVSGSIEYVAQGTPNCLGDDIYQSDYGTSVAGTVYSSPCKTDNGKLRYVYISNDETCPSGTTLLFYNSLGGSVSGPAAKTTN
jgi:hypothetical protein